MPKRHHRDGHLQSLPILSHVPQAGAGYGRDKRQADRTHVSVQERGRLVPV